MRISDASKLQVCMFLIIENVPSLSGKKGPSLIKTTFRMTNFLLIEHDTILLLKINHSVKTKATLFQNISTVLILPPCVLMCNMQSLNIYKSDVRIIVSEKTKPKCSVHSTS
jgi:hypothetical protein